MDQTSRVQIHLNTIISTDTNFFSKRLKQLLFRLLNFPSLFGRALLTGYSETGSRCGNCLPCTYRCWVVTEWRWEQFYDTLSSRLPLYSLSSQQCAESLPITNQICTSGLTVSTSKTLRKTIFRILPGRRIYSRQWLEWLPRITTIYSAILRGWHAHRLPWSSVSSVLSQP